jgi:hypothetical protein
MTTAQQEKAQAEFVAGAVSTDAANHSVAVRRRKIFYLVDSFNVGGTETQAVELARRMDPVKYDVTLACLRKEGPLIEKLNGSSVKVVEFHPKGGIDSPRGLYQLARMVAFLRRGKFDVVHAHDLWSNMIAVVAGKLQEPTQTLASAGAEGVERGAGQRQHDSRGLGARRRIRSATNSSSLQRC